MSSLVRESISKSKPFVPSDDRRIPIVVDAILKEDEAGMQQRNTKGEAPSRSGGTPRDGTKDPQKEDNKQRKDETLAPGQSPTQPGELRPGHNPENP